MNALMRENSEASVTGNETIERSIASMREKMDRDHAALAANQAALSERVHQNYSTLIEKINTVHHVLRDRIEDSHATLSAGQTALREKLETTGKELHSKIDTFNKDLGDRIDGGDQKLSDKIDAVDQKLSDKIDAVEQKLSDKIDTLSTAFAELRGFHKTVLWVCGGIVTLVTVAIGVGKAVGRI
jgi:DNA anti-recombination protein RmuC